LGILKGASWINASSKAYPSKGITRKWLGGYQVVFSQVLKTYGNTKPGVLKVQKNS
jgi:hypothetical protein